MAMAVINHAIKEYDLAGLRNPFIGLEVEAKDKVAEKKDKVAEKNGEGRKKA